MAGIKIAEPTVVSGAEWLVARKQLLVKEKELSRQRDAINRERRELPWVRVDQSQREGEGPGVSVFSQDENGQGFHTYPSYARGGDLLIGAYNYLDLTPKGRNETGPNFNLTDWVRHHDQY